MCNYKKIIFSDFSRDLWRELKASSLPILIYGMGNGADKIIAVFERYGIEYQDFFASDGFVRGHSFHGKTVLSYSQAVEKYPQGFDIVVSFGSKLPDVIEKIVSLQEKHRVFSPDVPVCGTELFNEEFFDTHEAELFAARELLCDEESKQVFDNVVRYKLTGRLDYLMMSACEENEADSLLKSGNYEIYADLGAYNGDTIKKYTALCPKINKIYAFEPDARNFKKLSKYCEENSINAVLLNNPACDKDKMLEFSASGNRNSSGASTGSFEHKTVQIEGKALDNVAEHVDFIKYDVEGLEYEAPQDSSAIFFGEKLSKKNVIGIALMCAALVSMNLLPALLL